MAISLRRGLLAAALLSCLPLASGAAQERAVAISPFLPADHWAVDALRRLDGLGLVDVPLDPGDRTPAAWEVLRAMDGAVDAAGSHSPRTQRLALGYRDRLRAEYSLATGGGTGGPPLFGRLAVGVAAREGVLLPGDYNPHSWADPVPVEDEAAPAADGRLGIALGRSLALSAAGSVRHGDAEVDELYAVGGWRALGAWAGRRPLGFGAVPSSSVVLAGGVPFDGGGLFLRDPRRFPAPLRVLGSIDLQAALARLHGGGRVGDPWFWAMRVAVMPSRRLTVGFNRGAMFGGDGNAPVTLRSIAEIAVGIHGPTIGTSNFENQVASVDVRYRTPLALPLVLYGEWGMEDNAGAWRDVPGIMAGLSLPALPGVPEVGVAAEVASFAPPCCGNPPWYIHHSFSEGWTEERALLAHPLGGEGRELRLRSTAALRDARLRLDGDLYARRRGPDNLFQPTWEGSSLGASARVDYDVSDRLGVELRLESERGDEGWSRSDGELSARLVF